MSTVLAVVSVTLVVDAVMSRLTAPVVRRPGGPPCAAHRAPRRPEWRLRRRVHPPGPGEVAQWCDDVARRLRAGEALAAAVGGALAPGRMAPVAAVIQRRVERGTPVAAAVGAIDDPGPAATLALQVVGAVAAVGGPAAEPIERVAATLRQHVADLHERRAQTAQARLSAVVMSVLPVAALGVSVTVSAPVRSAVASSAGLAAIGLGVALNAAGWCWMRRIVGPGR